jgi:branched-chain amino acid transport system substrate-binding protein
MLRPQKHRGVGGRGGPRDALRFLLPIAVVVHLSGCARRPPVADERARLAQASNEVTVAVVFPWERIPNMRYGDGLQMAVDEVNASGGIAGRPLRLKKYDDQGSVDEGVLIAQQIAGDPKVMGVIGHLQSYVTAPAAAIYEAAGLVMIAPMATDPALTGNGYRRVFRATYTDVDTGERVAEFMGRQFRRVAICYVRNMYGRGLANAFERRANELGVVIADRQSYDPGERVTGRSFSMMIDDWKTLELDAVFLAGEVPPAALFVAEARRQGLTVPIIGGDALSRTDLMTIAGRASEGVVVTTFFHPDQPRPQVQEFRRRFEARHRVTPDAAAAIGYDVVHVLAQAMRRAGSAHPDLVARSLRGGPVYEGVTGRFQFDEEGAAVGKNPVMMKVEGGRFVFASDAPAPSKDAVEGPAADQPVSSAGAREGQLPQEPSVKPVVDGQIGLRLHDQPPVNPELDVVDPSDDQDGP